MGRPALFLAMAMLATTSAFSQGLYANSIPGTAPYGPSVVASDGTVLLGQSTGLPDVGRPLPGRYCAVAMGGCPLEAPIPPGMVCNCRTPTGAEIGYSAR